MGRKLFEAKKFDIVAICPMCRSDIYWSLYAGQVGAETVAYCSKHPSSTRIILSRRDLMLNNCEWEGIARRNKAGSVDILNKDGTPVPRRVLHRK